MSEELDKEQEKAPKPKKKGKKGLVIALAVILPLLIAGGVFGAAFAGLIKIPGIKTPGKKQPSVATNYSEKHDETKLAKQTEQKKPDLKVTSTPEKPAAPIVHEPKPEIDQELGAKKLAGIWNSMEPDTIVSISANYKIEDLALVFSKMESEKVAKVLATIKDPKRAATISQEIQKIASVVPPPET